jgi:predicted phage tail component-like protein
MAHSRLYLNDIISPDYLVIKSIQNQLLPDIAIQSTKIPGRVGEVNQGTELGVRRIEIEIAIIGTTKANLDERERELTTWLFYDEPTKLKLPNNDKYYMAQVSDADIENTLIFGQGTITFLCTDPLAYNNEETVIPFAPTDTNPVQIMNNGNKETFPRIELTFNAPTTEFGILADEDYIYFGQPAPVDSTTPSPQKTAVLLDDCTTTTGWSAGISVDGGTIAGSLTSDGNYILQAGNDYGSGSTWHGGALVKSLGQQIQDFSVEYYINFKMTQPNQLGRIEIYLLDINNAVIGKMAMVDSTARSKSGRVEARLGPASGGKFLVNSEIGKEFYTFMYGRLFLQRIGQKYTFQIGKLDANYNFFGRWNTTFYDTANAYQSKLAGIQIHIAQWGTSPVIPTMNINQINVWDEKTLTNTEVPYVFVSGDTLTIDSNTGTILKNGEPAFYTLGDLGFTYPKLKPGTTNLAITAPIVSSGSITYRERWLR